MDVHTIVMFLLRWMHYIAGITWIGLLYFFNFINANVAKTYDADTKKKVVPELMPRALFFFRWGAMVTFLTGWIFIGWKIFIASDAGFSGEGGLMSSTWGYWISLGATLGTIMWFNVWFIIWPSQKRIITAVRDGQSPPEIPALVSKATLASKINTYLSVPLLFSMGAASHLPVFNPVLVIGMLAVSWALVYHLYKVAPLVGKLK